MAERLHAARPLSRYAFSARWTTNGVGTHANDILSATDRSFIAATYPRADAPTVTDHPRLVVNGPEVEDKIGEPGEEDLFTFTVGEPGRHVIETQGKTDVVMKLYGRTAPPDSSTRTTTAASG